MPKEDQAKALISTNTWSSTRQNILTARRSIIVVFAIIKI
jgi:hypothetical protein